MLASVAQDPQRRALAAALRIHLDLDNVSVDLDNVSVDCGLGRFVGLQPFHRTSATPRWTAVAVQFGPLA